MIKLKYTEWIDQYVEGGLQPADALKFETELSVNPQLALEYQLELDIEQALQENEILNFRGLCLEAQEEVRLIHSKGAKVVHFVRKYWYAAASLVLVALIAGGILLFQPGSYSNEKLFKMYYKSGDIGIKRSGNANMVEALMAYSKKDFVTASQAFEQVLKNDPSNIAVQYYCGISSIEIGNYQRAIDLFKGIISHGDNSYIDYAEWNLGLAYLANDQNNLAISEFTKIAENNKQSYQDQAVSILKKLDEKNNNEKIFNNLFFLILPF